MDKEYVEVLRRQHYAVFGEHEHSAAKLCTWLKKSLKNQGVCYKQKFYGIRSHRCLQMTPNIYCNQRCVFCWRVYGPSPDKLPVEWDEPKQIVEESFKAQQKLLSGFGGNPLVDKKKLKEAMNPNQFAISLTGEPTLYPYLDELIKEYGKHGTTFVVSNALLPEVISKINPTQLYLSLDAPDEETHLKINRPAWRGSWQRINDSLEILSSKKCRTAIRITLVKGLNDFNPEKYAKLVEKAEPDFLEVKGYMFIGGSRQRLSIQNMPRHEEVKAFAEQINAYLGYEYGGEQPISRVVMLKKR